LTDWFFCLIDQRCKKQRTAPQCQQEDEKWQYCDTGHQTYSQNNGADNYTYVPPPSGPAPNVTNWNVPMNNKLKAGESFTLKYQTIVK
jgi:hypothetical protein